MGKGKVENYWEKDPHVYDSHVEGIGDSLIPSFLYLTWIPGNYGPWGHPFRYLKWNYSCCKGSRFPRKNSKVVIMVIFLEEWIRVWLKILSIKSIFVSGCGGSCLYFQHPGGRGRRIYKASSRTARDTQGNPVSRNQNQRLEVGGWEVGRRNYNVQVMNHWIPKLLLTH